MKERRQSIVVVREDWTVSCYDPQLNLLWEKAVAHKGHDMITMMKYYKIDEVSVYLAPISLEEYSTGAVIVGASMSARDPNALANHIRVELGLAEGDSVEEHPEMKMRRELEHFSVYALDSVDGHVIWRHDGTSLEKSQYIKSLPVSSYVWRSAIEEAKEPLVHNAPGLSDWSLFRSSLMAELPHRWSQRDDTALRMAHFTRRHVGAGNTGSSKKEGKTGSRGSNTGSSSTSATSKANSVISSDVKRLFDVTGDSGKAKTKGKGKGSTRKLNAAGEEEKTRFGSVNVKGLSADAVLPHDSSEHIDHPNVLVAHTDSGIEVIALKTGVPITSLSLQADRTYADVDGDGVVDTLLLLENQQDVAMHGEVFAHHSNRLQHCTIMAISGLPARAQLFNGTLCQRSQHLHDPINQANNVRYSLPLSVSAAPPLVLRVLDARTREESGVRDLVVAINTGIVTSYTGKGEFNWQHHGAPSWPYSFKHPTVAAFDSDAIRADEIGGHDSVYAQVFVSGDKALALLSRDGEVLASSELPNTPVGRAVFGDFDSDGVTDVVVTTADAVLGYRLLVVQSTRGMLIALIVLVCIAVIVFFSNIRLLTDEPGSGSAPVNIPKLKKNVLSILRSTDEYHLD